MLAKAWNRRKIYNNMGRSVESDIRNPEVKASEALNNYLSLGQIALCTEQTLDKTRKLLEKTDRVVAPEGSQILVTDQSDTGHLIIEKFDPGPGRDGDYTQHLRTPREEVAGVVMVEDREFFSGRYIEYDSAVKGYYVYHQTGESRVLHRLNDKTSVKIVDQNWLDILYGQPSA
jgi:hypothetical protein